MPGERRKVLVTGASGMLGRCIVGRLVVDPTIELLTASRSGYPVTGARHFNVNIADLTALESLLQATRPETIIHCAALIDVNLCEKEREQAYATNVRATASLAGFPSVDRFIYMSTDSVYDGQTGNYAEGDAVNPLNYYGLTKLLGERAVIDSGPVHFILRANMIGFHVPPGHSLFEWAYSSLSMGTQINGFENVFFNPLYCDYLASVIQSLTIRDVPSGIYNLASNEPLSKFRFLKEIAAFFSFDQDLVTPITLDPGTLGALRPLNTVLATGKIVKAGFRMPPTEESLKLLFTDFSSRNRVN